MPSLQILKHLLIIVAFFTLSTFVIAQESDLYDEDSPEITARVARISFIRGEVQIKRSGERDWEDAALNLPLVEGDEIAASNNARVEIQFDSQKFLRLAEGSLLKITTLRDEGIAVSLSEGLLSLRVFSFEKDKGYFEIDAPQTTVSVQDAGLFRIDARDRYQVRVTATEGGQARIYSDSSGFTLRNGRSATVFLNNDRLGEWETADASRYFDEWDSWVAERDNKLSNLLNNSYYDKYYDRDIYGAEDLNDYGSWSDSDDYGKVWRPNYSSISSYNNWSPYRYGHWRWINPYGWVWVNDEPWGWSTYHYGRWVYDNRGWGWTPYSSYRPKRSWWRPALVTIFNINNDVCWYPLSHRDRYSDYNRYYRHNNRDFGNRRNDYGTYNSRGYRNLPENSIIGVRSDDFGRRRSNTRPISNQTARRFLDTNQTEIAQLPKYEERRREFRRESDISRSRQSEQIKTGVTERRSGVELDKQLQNERFRRNRQIENSNNNNQNNEFRRNGQFERRNQEQNSQTQNQPARQIILPTVNNEELERRNRERQQRRSDEQRTVNVPQNNNSIENNQRSRSRERDSDENNRVIVRVPDNNSMENNRRERTRDENSEGSRRRERTPTQNSESNNQNNVRRENPQENRPVYIPRNNDENRRSAPRAEESQPRVERRREESRQEPPRVEQRREQPRQEQPRVEPRREQPRQEQRREEPRQEQPRPKEPSREERRVPRTERKDQPIDN